MFKRFWMVVAVCIVSMGVAVASPVEVNTADQAALDGIKGIGPTTSKLILDERKKGGEFKDWADLEKRVKGVGSKRAFQFSQAGLTVNGQTAPAAGAEKSGKKVVQKAGGKPATAPEPAVNK